MPILHSICERRGFNSYDSFGPRQLREAAAQERNLTIFSGRNLNGTRAHEYVDNIHLTNTACDGIVAPYQTAIIQDWYARSNIEHGINTSAVLSAWVAWTQVTTVTMIMGSMPVTQLPLSDLLRHGCAGPDPFWRDRSGYICAISGCSEPCQHVYDDMAKFMLCASSAPGSNITQERQADEWNALSSPQQDAWRSAARAACDLTLGPPPIVLPIRQSLYVQIASEPRALAALLEVMPTNIAPQALIWVHIAGIAETVYAP